jgi:hypothetical protein
VADPLPRLVAALADRYRIEREVGAGGMATVYLAEDLRHGRQVALKVLRPELAATLGPERFFREIQVAARLQHPHILPLHDSGEAGGFLYFVMPYVEGESLRERLARVGELPVHDAVKILVEVVDALAYAHSQGVVHRDIKPDNVMLSGRHALVTDFGVAKAVSEATGRQQLTTAGVALGTPSYMAPEQAAADPNLDHRVDIYAVGAMAYELLTGRPPFTGMTSQQILAAHVTQAPDPVSRHRPSCPPGLEAVIMRCLAKRAADRFQTAEELLQNLEPLATPSGGMTPTQTRPATAWQPGAARAKWVPIAVGAGVLAIAALGWLAFRGRGGTPPVQLERTQLTFTGNASSPGLSQDGSRIAYATRQCDTAGICTLDIVIQDVGGAGSATVLRGALGVWEIKWTADTRYLVFGASFGANRWGAFSVPTLGGDPRYLGCCQATIVGESDTALVSRPASVGDSIGWLRWVTVADGVVRDSLPIRMDASGANLLAESFPDGDRLLVSHDRPRSMIAAVSSRTGVTLDSIIFAFPKIPISVNVAPDGRSLIAVMPRGQGQGEVDFLRHRVSTKGRITTIPDTVARQLTINAGGDVSGSGALVYGFGPNEYSVWALRRDTPTSMQFSQRRLATSTALLSGSLSPTGDRILLNRPATSGDERRQLSVMPFDSGPESPLGPPMELVDWDWAQDGKRVTLVSPRGRDSLTISRMDVPSARTTQVGVMARGDYVVMETVAGGGEILIPTAQSFRRFGIPGLADSTFQLPPALGSVVSIDPAPDGKAFVSISWDPAGDSLLAQRISIVDGSVTRLGAFAAEGSQPPKWFDDGSIVIPILETAWTLAWYRIPPGGGIPVRMGTPPRYPAVYRFSGDGLRVMARPQERRTDIYLVPNFGDVLKH